MTPQQKEASRAFKKVFRKYCFSGTILEADAEYFWSARNRHDAEVIKKLEAELKIQNDANDILARSCARNHEAMKAKDAEIAKLHHRLEIDRICTESGKEPADLDESMDGISCRDETIGQQDRVIEKSCARIAKKDALLAQALEVLKYYQDVDYELCRFRAGFSKPDLQSTADAVITAITAHLSPPITSEKE